MSASAPALGNPFLPPPSRGTVRQDDREFSLLQLLRPEILADPHLLFHRIRDHEPVRWDKYLRSWVVTGYPEAVQVLSRGKAARTPTAESLEAMGLSVLCPYADLMRKQLLFLDPPDHTRIRALCAVAFTPRRVEALRASTQEIADSLLDAVAQRGHMEVIADFAGPFPALLLTRMIGLPSEDSERLRKWGNDLGQLLGNFEHDAELVSGLVGSVSELRVYLAAEVTRQQTTPRDGVIAALLAAEADGHPLTFDELVANIMLLIGGGLEELTNLITNGLYSLLLHPGQLACFRDQPGIAASAVEELLRFESTTQYTGRIAPEPMLLGGHTIARGDSITVVLAAANRDPARFRVPDALDLSRTDNRHLAFGWASHYCLGAPLVRLAAQVAFPAILQRLPGLTLETPRPRWRSMAAMRAMQELRVSFQPATVSMGVR